MKPSINELQDTQRFRLITEIDIFNPTPFFKEFAKGKFTTVFLFLLCLIAGYLGGIVGVKIAKGDITFQSTILQIFMALGFMLVVLLPIHEGIHAITYWLKGAKDIRFSIAKKGFAVFTMANRHVVHLREYPLLAAAPFIVITLIISTLIYLDPANLVFFTILLIIHSFACMGDMILINFAINHWHKPIYNYDDFDLKRSYFFEEIERS
jgi:hypothetical protein